jgi:hypothetical protein
MQQRQRPPDVWIIVYHSQAYGPFETRLDACDAAARRWGTEGDWEPRLLNPSLTNTCMTVRKAPPQVTPPS